MGRCEAATFSDCIIFWMGRMPRKYSRHQAPKTRATLCSDFDELQAREGRVGQPGMRECGLWMGFMRRPNWPENTTHSGADPVRKPRPPIGPMPLNAAGDWGNWRDEGSGIESASKHVVLLLGQPVGQRGSSVRNITQKKTRRASRRVNCEEM